MGFVKAFFLTLIVLAVVSVALFEIAKPPAPAEESTTAPPFSGGNATGGANATNATNASAANASTTG